MKYLKLAVQVGAAAIGLLLVPWLFLRVTRLAIPKVAWGLAALALELIPVEIALFLIYFNAAVLRAFFKGIKARRRAEVITSCLVLPPADLLLGYTFVTAVRAFWLR